MDATASGIGSSNQTSGDVPAISAVIELDVYSGQPNPRWELSGKICQDILEEITHLRTARPGTARCDQLGYRGLKVIMNIPPDKHEEFYVCNGYIFLYCEEVESVLIDNDRKVERKLLASGMEMPDQKLMALISQILQTLPELQQKSVQHK